MTHRFRNFIVVPLGAAMGISVVAATAVGAMGLGEVAQENAVTSAATNIVRSTLAGDQPSTSASNSVASRPRSASARSAARLGGEYGIKGVLDEVAAFLGLETAALQTRLDAGETLADIATAEGKSVDDLKAAITTAVTANVTAAVTSGEIDQARADEVLADLAANIDTLVTEARGSGDCPDKDGDATPSAESGTDTSNTSFGGRSNRRSSGF